VSTARTLRGRPAATSHAAIEREAFALFAAQGFEATTLEAIANRLGVAPRTVTRYYASKNDIAWGQFDRTLDSFREILGSMPSSMPLWERVHRGVLAFNDFPDDADPSHRDRMALIVRSPTLQAHSVLRYAQWRGVIADYVAAEIGQTDTDGLPTVVGYVSLSLALSAYEQWLAVDDGGRAELIAALDGVMAQLRAYLG
jgi:TetR/AcrR family transcriptional regulator, regulator of mycofactocin system